MPSRLDWTLCIALSRPGLRPSITLDGLSGGQRITRLGRCGLWSSPVPVRRRRVPLVMRLVIRLVIRRAPTRCARVVIVTDCARSLHSLRLRRRWLHITLATGLSWRREYALSADWLWHASAVCRSGSPVVLGRPPRDLTVGVTRGQSTASPAVRCCRLGKPHLLVTLGCSELFVGLQPGFLHSRVVGPVRCSKGRRCTDGCENE